MQSQNIHNDEAAASWAPVAVVVGTLTQAFGVAMILPAIVEYISGGKDVPGFLLSSLFTIFAGILIYRLTPSKALKFTLRQAFLATTCSWVTITFFGALPFLFTSVDLTLTDALFESMSAITTTGSTVITGLDFQSYGVLFWRSLLQWLGGLGIIVISVAAFPTLQLGGLQLFKAESFSAPDQILPRASKISGQIILIYVCATFICLSMYMLFEMPSFDAINHGMTTVATGGMSTRDASIGAFGNLRIEIVATFFMIFGSIPFPLYVQFFSGRIKPIYYDSQVRFFLKILAVFILMMWAYQEFMQVDIGFHAFVKSAFNVTSIMTGTGYASTDYTLWGPFSVSIFFVIMFIGGCASSTSCGVKIFRVQVIYEVIRRHIHQVVYPNAVFTMRYNGRLLPEQVAASVISFFIVYFFSFLFISIALSFTGLDTLTAFSAAGSAISNVGPGLGAVIGPAGTYASLSDPSKWILTFAMLLGRLELFAILIFFLPQFWQD